MAHHDKENPRAPRGTMNEHSRFELIFLSSSPEIYSKNSMRAPFAGRCHVRAVTYTSSDLLQEVVNVSKLQNRGPLVVMVELETMGGFSKGFSYLRVLRESYPDVVTILLTRKTREHDLSQYRLPISDVTLRIPFSENEFDVALYAAVKNNTLWQSRVEELRGPQQQ
jgi:hypothetical protein